MKLIFLFVSMILTYHLPVKSQLLQSPSCEEIEKSLQNRMCGVGYAQEVKSLVECYLDNNQSTQGIALSVKRLGDVDELGLLSPGWSDILCEFFDRVYGKEEMKEESKNTEIDIQGLDWLGQLQGARLLGNLKDWSRFIRVSVELFGNEVLLLPRLEADFERNLVSDVMSGNLELGEVYEYFTKRWEESILYKKMNE